MGSFTETSTLFLHSYVTVGDTGALYDKLMNLVMRLANHGVIHGDFNAVFTRGVDPYAFFTDPDPEFDVGDQFGSRSGSNTDPGL